MLNNQDEKYDDEESEYHFSDEDVSYDVDSESPKTTKSQSSAPGQGIVGKLTQSKRMMIGLGVFIALVFVVFKMVSPTSTNAPGTDITPPQIAATQPAMTTAQTVKPQQVQQATIAKPPVIQAPTVQPQQTVAAQSYSIQPKAPAVMPVAPPVEQSQQQAVLAQQAQMQQLTQQQPSPNTSQAMPQQTMPSGAMPAPSSPYGASEQQLVPSSQMTQSSQSPAQQLMQVPQQMISSMTQRIPAVASQAQSGVSNSSVMMPSMNVPGASNVDPRLATMAADNDRMINQLQAQYAQKLADYQNQNKNLQDQLQSLNAKMTGMESQMNQLVQTLSKQTQAQQQPQQPAQTQDGAMNTEPNNPISQAVEPNIAYNVQAIIPGRAWLRSDAGDTITVAEGDDVKGIGRVTKIDPYDGVVQINTGSKTVSLSYGNNG